MFGKFVLIPVNWKTLIAVSLWVLVAIAASAGADPTFTLPLTPGTYAEADSILNAAASSVEGQTRKANAGGGWTYRLVVPPTAQCRFIFEAAGEPAVRVSSSDGKLLPIRTEKSGNVRIIHFSAPPKHSLGGRLDVQVRAVGGPIAVRNAKITFQLPDKNRDGISDLTEQLMGLKPGQRAVVTPRPPTPRTSFQTGERYAPEIGVPSDAVLVYSSDPAVYQTWADKHYILQTMGGFRDGPEYVKQHPGEVQTDRNGKLITIGENSFYMVPTPARIEIAKQFYAAAIAAGSTAICPEEPEIWAHAGFSEAFQQEWQARYGIPWQPPDSSVDARYRSEQLKAFLTQRLIGSILTEAQNRSPAVRRMVAVHSPVTYYHWGIVMPHYALLRLPVLQEIIGQVWTGTARTPVRVGGVRAERTFELGYLEYSSLYQLVRGTGKRVWFLMDPVEDTPGLPIEDYRRNYLQTLLAALMFPEVDSYEVMPWPQRIFGNVPNNYTTLINTVVGALCEMWRYSGGQMEAGCTGIATFIADSMGWQRASPARSDYDGFYALCLPLLLHGVPVQVLSLDRAGDPGYLNPFRTLLLSYDFLKPSGPEIHRALADWVRRGGSLVVFGGTDAYNAVSDSWWRKAGYESPLEDLFARMELPVRNPKVIDTPPEDLSGYQVLLRGDGTERSLRNRRRYTMDLTGIARANRSVCVRFEDVTPEDGWGAYVVDVELRFGDRLAASFRAGSEIETRFLVEEHNTGFNGEGRFADRDAYWVYRFDIPRSLPPNTPITLIVTMGNGFLVKARPARPAGPLLEAVETPSDRSLVRLRLPRNYPVTLYAPPAGATPLYRLPGEERPAVWQARYGQGTVLFVGVAPGAMTAKAQGSRWVRWLAQRAYEATNATYRESDYFAVRRGPYLAVRALGREYTTEGRFVDLLSPTLAVVNNPIVPARGWAFLSDLGPVRGAPRVVTASGRLRARSERSNETAFLVQAPAKTEGGARLWSGKRRVKVAKAFTVLGAPVPVSAFPDGDTVFLRYANDPDGVVVRVVWQ